MMYRKQLLLFTLLIFFSTFLLGCDEQIAARFLPVSATVNALSADLPQNMSSVTFSADQLLPILPTDRSTALADTPPSEFTTGVISATTPFNFVFPEWQATLPVSSTMTLQIRLGSADGSWGDWINVKPSPDLSDPKKGIIGGSIINTPDSNLLLDQVQMKVSLGRSPTGELPVLHNLSVVFVDASGPTTKELIDQNSLDRGLNPQSLTSSYPKPAVVPRSKWCTAPECTYKGFQSYPATHLIIHHTVSSNEITDWAAHIRAVWSFHTFTRGWGDVGYNFLIDPNGTIYEGHLGGDDAIGTHASEANRGGMGVALMGTFDGEQPPRAMLNALAELLAWKSTKNGINLWDASRLPLFSYGHLDLIGHRDVYGTTTCPGDLAHTLIKEIRQQVSDKLQKYPDYTYIDEQDAGFSKSNATWYDGPYQCGFNSHAWYTFSTSDSGKSTNNGTWRLNIPNTGRYAVDVFVPFCNTGKPDSQQDRYRIRHANGTTNLTLNQKKWLGLWMPLGEYEFKAGGTNDVRLVDLTSSENGIPIWFDALRYKPIDVATKDVAVNLFPTEDLWVGNRKIQFSWEVNTAITNSWLQISSDPNFSDILVNQEVGTTALSYEYTFDQDYPNLYWRVKMKKSNGSDLISVPTGFHLDSAGPTSQIKTVFKLCDGNYKLFWDGFDTGSGIAHYTISYKKSADTKWTTILNATTATEATWAPPSGTDVYQFRVLAVDKRGNVETAKPNGDVESSVAIPCNIDPPTLQTPTQKSWQRARTTIFSWSIPMPWAVARYRFELATDPAFTNSLVRETLPATQTTYQWTTNRDYPKLYWRVVVISLQLREFYANAYEFQIDTVPPVSAITGIVSADGKVQLTWQGSDSGAGIKGYRLEYQQKGTTEWVAILNDTLATSATFQPQDSAENYWFRTVATDLAGNIELGKNGKSLVGDQYRSLLPILFRAEPLP